MVELSTTELTYGKSLTFILSHVLAALKGIEEDITTDLIIQKLIEYRPEIEVLAKDSEDRFRLLQRLRNNLNQFKKSGLVSIEVKKSHTKTNYLVIHLKYLEK